MTDTNALDLLREALDLLNDAPRFSLRRDRRRDSYGLAGRIDAFLVQQTGKIAPDNIVAAATERWRPEPEIRVADRATMQADSDGLWISAWLLIGGLVPPIDRSAYLSALGTLSPFAREVFLLHRQDGLTLPAVAKRLGLPIAETEALYRTALVELHRLIFPQA